MFFAYVDESGDAGPAGSKTYTLGCILVEADRWPDLFDGLLAFRRFLKTSFGVPIRGEVKTSYLMRNSGPFSARPLSEAARHDLFRQSMRLHAKLGLPTFAVVIDKGRLAARDPSIDPRDVAWEYLIQRFERFSSGGAESIAVEPGHAIALIHDEGDAARVRKIARKARRAGSAGSAFGTGSLKRPAKLLIEDPFPKNSTHSFFLQHADLVAYAAFRRLYPPPRRLVNIVPPTMWDELGTARFAEANKVKGGVPGIVHWPRP